jgi:hypothetical protein
MIHVVTVHWQSAKWIDPQLRYLERNIDRPYRVYAALEGIDPAEWERFHFAADLQGTHPQKLNALAAIVTERAAPDDILVFIDGDALPVQPIGPWMEHLLGSYPLVAVRRDENLGDRQPHPCFSFTTCAFWKEIRGDWGKGGTWTNSLGDTVTDVGGNLLHKLDDRGVDWLPLLRTNTVDVHPLWFAVYGHRVYHHGAGFRSRQSRVDLHLREQRQAPKPTSPSLEGLVAKVIRQPSLVTTLRPRHVAEVPTAARMSVVKRRRKHSEKRLSRQFEGEDPLERDVFRRLTTDPDFYREFDPTPVEPGPTD